MAKKKIINLSELSQYTLKDDISKSKTQYNFGSWLADNAGDIVKTGAGIGLTATGVAAPVGVGLIAQGATGLAANNINDPNAVNTIGAAGQVASAIPMTGQMANGGPMDYQGGGMMNNSGLTEYNGGGTHEENPRGGIDVGANAQVEDKETRWEDYIFSDRLQVPGSKRTFAEESKKIEKRYPRENDEYDRKAKEREMRALMSIQENERERMDIEHSKKMNEMFACGGKMKHANGGNIEGDDARARAAAAITPGTNVANTNILSPRQTDLTSKYKYLEGYTPKFNESRTGIIEQGDAVDKRKAELDALVLQYRNQFADVYGVPKYDKAKALELARQANKNYDSLSPEEKKNAIAGYMSLPDFTGIDPNVVYDKSKLPQEDLQSFYEVLREKQAIRDAQGFQRKQYYGSKEAEQMGYNENTPLEDLNFGIRFLTGAQDPQVFQRAYGGSTFKSYSYDMLEPMATPEDVSLAEALSFSQGNDHTQGEPTKADSPYTQGYKNKFSDYAVLGAQNAGNLYNLYQGMQPAEETNYQRVSPKYVDYSAALKNLQSQYDSAANVARENIRGAATSSGQALSNTIAQDVAMNKARASQESQIKEQEQNQNVGIFNQADQTNVGISNQEMDVNLQNEARRQETLQTGLTGLGQSLAEFSRDTKAYQGMYDYMRTNNYSWGRDPQTGKPVMISNLTGQPVQ